MPVTVQLPGYNHAAPAVGLAQVIGAGFGAYKDYNQAQQSQAQAAQSQAATAQQQQATEQGKTEFEQRQKLLQLANMADTPEAPNPMVPNARAEALTKLSVIEQSGLVPHDLDKKGQPVSSPLFDAIKGRINDPKQTPFGIQQIMEPLDKTFDPLIKAQLEGLGKITAAEKSAEPRNRQADIATDEQTSRAVNLITDDGELQNHVLRLQGAQKILDQLADARAGKFVDTKQFLGDMNAEYSSLLLGSTNAALGKQERTEYTVKKADLAAAIQSVTADPTSINSPKIIAQLENQMKGLQGNIQGFMKKRGEFLKRDYQHNPAATKAMANKINELISNYATTDNNESSGKGSSQPPKQSEQTDYPIGTKAKSKTGVPVVYKGNGQWAPQ